MLPCACVAAPLRPLQCALRESAFDDKRINEHKSKSRSMHQRKALEKLLEGVLFNSRWLLAPFYIGLVVSLAMLLVAFIGDLVHILPNLLQASPEEIILSVLTLIDLSLAGNLVVIVMFSGYENFVSKIDTGASEDRPSWMGTLDFSGLKMKLIGSIVAISAISLLRAFMTLSEPGSAFDEMRIRWLVILHLTFVVSGLLFAAMDWVAAQAESH
ncbi:TIGR00645 family protein [Trinickia sp. LjRoot230]|uniref:TIGR00645 family protein n=1 Tax=Trinickia sp. LjRoot230 TaxID=3342288 RepID=UPI003ECC9ABF